MPSHLGARTLLVLPPQGARHPSQQAPTCLPSPGRMVVAVRNTSMGDVTSRGCGSGLFLALSWVLSIGVPRCRIVSGVCVLEREPLPASNLRLDALPWSGAGRYSRLCGWVRQGGWDRGGGLRGEGQGVVAVREDVASCCSQWLWIVRRTSRHSLRACLRMPHL